MASMNVFKSIALSSARYDYQMDNDHGLPPVVKVHIYFDNTRMSYLAVDVDEARQLAADILAVIADIESWPADAGELEIPLVKGAA